MDGNIILVGVGGAGMSALARMFLDLGYTNIIGIDNYESQTTQVLISLGIDVRVGRGKYTVRESDIVIFSEAVRESDEVKSAYAFSITHKHLAPMSYFEFLGEISKYFRTICVAGTKGKTTGTAMLGYVMESSIENFGLAIVGGMLPDWGNSNMKLGKNIKDLRNIMDMILRGKDKMFDFSLIKKYWFLVESCEYKRHFLYFDPEYSLITNVFLDHTDYYKNIEDYQKAFQQLSERTKYGVFGLMSEKTIDFLGDSLRKLPSIHFDFKNIFGEHNQKNASLIIGFFQEVFGFDLGAKEKIENFLGIWRRQELLYTTKNGTRIFTDYAHNSESLSALYDSFREHFPDKKIHCIFQPHQARRVLEFRDSFVETMKKFDGKIIFPIYAARENIEDLKSMFPKRPFTDIEKLGEMFANEIDAQYINTPENIFSYCENLGSNDLVIIVTAGDLDFQIRSLLK